MYTGSKITQDNKGITLDQTDYVQNLEIFDLDPERLKRGVTFLIASIDIIKQNKPVSI